MLLSKSLITSWQTVPEPWSSGCEAPIAEPCWSVERSTCRCRPIGAGDGRRERQAGSCLQGMLQLNHAAPCSVDQEGQLELDSSSSHFAHKMCSCNFQSYSYRPCALQCSRIFKFESILPCDHAPALFAVLGLIHV